MKYILPLTLAATVLSACAQDPYGRPTSFIDSDLERGLVGAAAGYAATEYILDGNQDRGAIIGGLAGVFCDDVGACSRSR